MAYSRTYQYETSPRKLKPEYETIKRTYPKKSTARRISNKEEIKRVKAMYIKSIMYIAIGFIGLFIISYRYSLIDDTYATLKNKKAEIALLEKETTQLEASIESGLNLEKIEEDAKNLLGMQQLKSEQKVYVTLPKIDHLETSANTEVSSKEKGNWLTDIINKILSSFS